jgi:D-xylose 1-dehydrogenase (NADP+, D-xylono-1,5-lactone-forming)
MSYLRWGLLGTARINRAVIPVLQSSSRNTLVAVASRSIERAREHATQWNIPRTLAPYEALLSDPEIDAIYISLPNSLHADWTVRALEAGKHVLCEKPLALTPHDVERIAEAAARTGRVASEAFMYRHHPLTTAVESVVRDGHLGALRLIRGAFTFPLTRGGDIRLDPALGGGSLWDVGCYPVSYACHLAGAAPTEVVGWQELASTGVDTAFAGMMRFDGELVAQFDAGFRAAFRAEMEVVGTDATVRVERAFKGGPESRLLITRGNDTTDLPFDPEPSYTGEIEDFAAATLDGGPSRISLAESLRTVEVICALYRSARHNAPERLAQPPARSTIPTQ